MGWSVVVMLAAIVARSKKKKNERGRKAENTEGSLL
jgi:hypothetical protein